MPTTESTAEVEHSARVHLIETLDLGIEPAELDLDEDLLDYGLTSLHKVLFLTALCADRQVDLGHFTEHDLAGMRTLRQTVAALLPYLGKAA